MSVALGSEFSTQGKFVMIPNELARNHGLSPRAVVTLLALASHGREWIISVGDLAKEAGIGRTTTFAALDELHERGLIEREERVNTTGRQPSAYRVNLGIQRSPDSELTPPIAPVIQLRPDSELPPESGFRTHPSPESELPIRKKEPSTKEPKNLGATRKQQVPEDWTPDASATEKLIAAGFTQAQIDYELPKFVDHHRAKGSTFARIELAFGNWMRNARDFAKQRAPLRANRPSTRTTDDGRKFQE